MVDGILKEMSPAVCEAISDLRRTSIVPECPLRVLLLNPDAEKQCAIRFSTAF
jgi:hypothetical protein